MSLLLPEYILLIHSDLYQFILYPDIFEKMSIVERTLGIDFLLTSSSIEFLSWNMLQNDLKLIPQSKMKEIEECSQISQSFLNEPSYITCSYF